MLVQRDNVIACAASSPNNANEIFVFLYPRPGAQNVRLYGSIDTSIDKNDFSNYEFIADTTNPVFGGALEKFIVDIDFEIWFVVSFEEGGMIHTSTPIRIKQNQQPTLWNDQVSIDQSTSLMPLFQWADVPDSAIYFEVVSDGNDDLLSGTYTTETNFQYYNTSNVVLNITQGVPPNLIANELYGITVMAVSADNWVNTVFQNDFIAQ